MTLEYANEMNKKKLKWQLISKFRLADAAILEFSMQEPYSTF